MMQQLITIETIPITIKYVEKEPFSDVGRRTTGSQVLRHNNTAAVKKSNPVRIKTDSFVQSNPVDTYNLTYTATAQYSDNGNLKLNLQMTGIGTGAFDFRQIGRDISNIINRLPGVHPDTVYELDSMQVNLDLGQLQNALSWPDTAGIGFTLPDFEIEIVERPRVIIKYVGGPLYIPRSADPNYETSGKIDTKA